MKQKIRNIIKSSRIFYLIYYYIFSMLLKALGLFCKTDNNKVLFVVYGGKRYDDSPKVLYEYIKEDDRFKNLELIWAFEKPQAFNEIPDENKVKIDSFKYYLTALRSKYWITNSSITRGLNFKKNKTKYVIFQHGTAGIKTLGQDIPKNNKSFRIKNGDKPDVFIIQGKKEKDIIKKAFGYDDEVYNIGLPRNDELFDVDEKRIHEARRRLNIPDGKKVIIYTPTFREFYKDSGLNTFVKMPFDIEKMREALADEYVLVITAHYEVSKMLNIPKGDSFVINAFDYPCINDILIAGDIMISDYSSVVFDYAILERPIFCFGYDYDVYKKERGTYIDLDKFFCDGVIKSQEKLIEAIRNMDVDKEKAYSKKIKSDYIYGSEKSVIYSAEIIFGVSDNKKKVLHCLPGSLNMGGIESYVLNLYKHIDRYKYELDFLVHGEGIGQCEEEIKKLGGRVFHLPIKARHPRLYKKEFSSLIKRENYKTIHIHSTYAYSKLEAKIAHEYGVKNIIIHSHNTSAKIIKKIYHIFNKRTQEKYLSYRFACSKSAANWMFTKKGIGKDGYFLAKNGIDTARYKFDLKIRNKIRDNLNIRNDQKVVGFIGRLSYQKNPIKAIEIFSLLQKNIDCKLVIVGDGDLKDKIQEIISRKNLSEKVIFTGSVKNVNDYMQAMDILIMPSRYEGLPVVLLEAQSAGLKCVISDVITNEIDLTDKIVRISKKASNKDWASVIISSMRDKYNREIGYSTVNQNGYDIKTTSSEMQRKYSEMDWRV